MKIRGIKSQPEEVEISEIELINYMIQLVQKKFDINGYFLNSNKTEVRVDDEWLHGSVTDSLVRLATPEDISGFELINSLNMFKERI